MKLFRLSGQDRRLSSQALPLVIEARWRLWRTPFPVLHAQWRAQVQAELEAATARGLSPDAVAPPDQRAIEQAWNCAHAVRRMAFMVPLASCLTQAMALQLLLARHGYHCSVCIGVERRKAAPQNDSNEAESQAKAAALAKSAAAVESGFFAHAWVEWHGRVLIGGDVRRWKPLTIFAPVSAPSASTPSN